MTEDSEAAFASLASDYWKLLRSFERLASELPEERSTRTKAQARFSAGRLVSHLEAAGLQLVTFDGQVITPSLPVVAVNADEVGGHKLISVESTIEPAIVSGSRVVLMGRVIAICGE